MASRPPSVRHRPTRRGRSDQGASMWQLTRPSSILTVDELPPGRLTGKSSGTTLLAWIKAGRLKIMDEGQTQVVTFARHADFALEERVHCLELIEGFDFGRLF